MGTVQCNKCKGEVQILSQVSTPIRIAALKMHYLFLQKISHLMVANDVGLLYDYRIELVL